MVEARSTGGWPRRPRHCLRRPPWTSRVALPGLGSVIRLSAGRSYGPDGRVSLEPGPIVGRRIGLLLDARVDIEELVENAPREGAADQQVGPKRVHDVGRHRRE